MRMGWRTHVLEHRTKCTYTVHDVRNPYGRKKNRTRVRFRAQAPILLVKVEKKNVDCFLGLFFVFSTAVRFSVRPYDFCTCVRQPIRMFKRNGGSISLYIERYLNYI